MDSILFSTQAVSIDFLRNRFEKYGSKCLSKIEIFSDDHSNTKFSHVTFKESETAYLALLDCSLNLESNRIIEIRPADVHLQPDNPVDSATSPFYNLPNGCLLAIFNFCSFDTLAMVSLVCKKMSDLLRREVFSKSTVFNFITANDVQVEKTLQTVSHLVQCLNPSVFHLKIFRNSQISAKWPAITVDLKSTKSQISIDKDFLKSEWLPHLRKIAKCIKSVHLRISINDDDDFVPFNGDTFPNATELTVTGYSIRCDIPNLSLVISFLPKLETISLRNGTIDWQHIIDYCRLAKKLQSIGFKNCCFDSTMDAAQIVQIADAIKNGDKRPRLGLIFDCIQTIASNETESLCSIDSCSCESKTDPTEISTYSNIKKVLNLILKL